MSKKQKAVFWKQGFRAEVMADCYDGPECDQIRKVWKAYAEGDMDSDTSETPLTFELANLPVGAIVTVEYPECPECHQFPQDCKCGYDWEKWIRDYYE